MDAVVTLLNRRVEQVARGRGVGMIMNEGLQILDGLLEVFRAPSDAGHD